MTTPLLRKVDAATPGLRCNVQEWAETGFPCVAIHGLGDAGCVWSDFAANSPGLRVAAIDLPGHGYSDWDASHRYTTAAMTNEVAAVIARLGLGRAVLIGHSIGGDIALRLAVASGWV